MDDALKALVSARRRATNERERYAYLEAGGMAIASRTVEMATAKYNYERADEDVAYYEKLVETLPSVGGSEAKGVAVQPTPDIKESPNE